MSLKFKTPADVMKYLKDNDVKHAPCQPCGRWLPRRRGRAAALGADTIGSCLKNGAYLFLSQRTAPIRRIASLICSADAA